jgi:hypothetical protein
MTTPSFKTNVTGCSLRFCALLVVALLVLEPVAPVHAQVSAAGEPPRSLQIIILDGEGALNNIQERTAREPIVQVQDHNRKPVAGAVVVFSIHGGAEGASGSFAGGASTLTVTTAADGTAHAAGISPNATKGSWQIEVTATLGALAAAVVINELNYVPLVLPPATNPTANTNPVKPPSHGIFSKPIAITGGILIVGIIVVIAVVATQGNGPTKITTGTGTVGPPVSGGIRIRF